MGADNPVNKPRYPIVDNDTDNTKAQEAPLTPDAAAENNKAPIEKVEHLEHALDELEAMIDDLAAEEPGNPKEKI